jgi:Mrp family chromosome partitioning ATPase
MKRLEAVLLSEEQVRSSLKTVLVPALTRSIEDLNLVREVTVDESGVKVILASTGLLPGAQDWIKDKVKEAIGNLDKVKSISVEYTEAKPADLNTITNVIAVMSGKGGVGKSLVSSLIAISLKRQGYEVGILDADITGPSIPRMFGTTDRPSGNESGILPVLSTSGIEIMSINLLLPSEDEAVIWRGPLIGRAITQFWEEVLWGKLDYLIVDLPPGTADAPLTVMQTLPVTGVVIVLTPQDLTRMIVKKAVRMAQQMQKPVLGVVENMSYLYVPEIDKKIELFGKSQGKEMAAEAGAAFLGQLPIDPQLAALCDDGKIERYDSEIINSLGKELPRIIEEKSKQ